MKLSAAAMVFGLGDITLPALPPPTIASKMAILEISARCAMARAIGETVITATSINTPTAVSSIVATASASRARFSPTFVQWFRRWYLPHQTQSVRPPEYRQQEYVAQRS